MSWSDVGKTVVLVLTVMGLYFLAFGPRFQLL